MGDGPHGPVDLHRGPELFLNLTRDLPRLAIHDLHGAEEDRGEDGGPEDLVDGGFRGDSGRRRGRLDHDGAVEEAVPVVSDGAVEGEAEGAHLRGARDVPALALGQVRGLRDEVAEHEACEGLRTRWLAHGNCACVAEGGRRCAYRHRLGGQRARHEGRVVSGPD